MNMFYFPCLLGVLPMSIYIYVMSINAVNIVTPLKGIYIKGILLFKY